MKGLPLLALLFFTLPVFAGGGEKLAADQFLVEGAALAGNAVAEASDPGAADRLRARLSGLNALRANFTQRVVDAQGYEMQTMTGTMTVARPGRIHWQTQPPYEQLLVSDATTLWLYDKDLEQVTVRPFMRDISDSPAMIFIGDLSALEDKYRITRGLGEGGVERYSLVPRDTSGVYQGLTLSFRDDTPVAMSLEDSLGQVTRVEFSDVELNPALDDGLFTFAIPAGVDVLYND